MLERRQLQTGVCAQIEAFSFPLNPIKPLITESETSGFCTAKLVTLWLLLTPRSMSGKQWGILVRSLCYREIDLHTQRACCRPCLLLAFLPLNCLLAFVVGATPLGNSTLHSGGGAMPWRAFQVHFMNSALLTRWRVKMLSRGMSKGWRSQSQISVNAT